MRGGWGPPFWNGDGKRRSTASIAARRASPSISRAGGGFDALEVADPERGRCRHPESAARHSRQVRPHADALSAAKPIADLVRHRRVRAARTASASKPGYDPLAQASTGIMSVTGEGGTAAGACRGLAGRHGLRHVGGDRHARRAWWRATRAVRVAALRPRFTKPGSPG